MKHHIIVKFKNDAPALEEMLPRIDEIFSDCLKIEGISGYRLIKNCIDRSNRYDLMIVVEMEKSALEIYDASAAHKIWKEEFGSLIESKCIFDCE